VANIKSASSIEKLLFGKVDALAQKLEISWSYLFGLAARGVMQRLMQLLMIRLILMNEPYSLLATPHEVEL